MPYYEWKGLCQQATDFGFRISSVTTLPAEDHQHCSSQGSVLHCTEPVQTLRTYCCHMLTVSYDDFQGKTCFIIFLSITAFWITAIRVFEMECHLCPWLHPAYLMVQCDHLVTFSDLNSLGKAGPRREPLPRGEDLSFPEENELWIGASLSCSLDFWLRGPARQGGSFNVPLGSQGGFPGGSAGKNPAANGGDSGSIPGSGRSPGEGNGNSLQDSCLENPMDRGVQEATVHGVKKSWTGLSD